MCMVMLFPWVGRADLLVSEDFDYAAGAYEKGELNGGSGWTGAWTSDWTLPWDEVFYVAGGSLDYPGVAGTGNRLSVEDVYIAPARRDMPMFGLGDETIWVSFVAHFPGDPRTPPAGPAVFAVTLLDPMGPAIQIAVNNYERTWSINGMVDEEYVSVDDPTGVSADGVCLLLARIDFSTTGPDVVHVWVNPDLQNGPDDADAMVLEYANLQFSQLVVFAQEEDGPAGFDSFKLGNTLADVVPEPTAGVLLVGGGLVLALARRRG